MCKLLCNDLPSKLSTCKGELEIEVDFRKWIEFEVHLANESLSERDKILALLSLYKQLPCIDSPEDLSSLIESLLWFYRRGNILVENTKVRNKTSVSYSFEKDFEFIYGDFIRFYNIDLFVQRMHWWKFIILFEQLPKESKMKEIMMIRNMKLSSKMSSDQRKYYLEMKRLYALHTSQMKSKDIASILMDGVMCQNNQ